MTSLVKSSSIHNNIPNIITTGTPSKSNSIISNEISPGQEEEVGLLSIGKSVQNTTSKYEEEQVEEYNTRIPLIESQQYYTKNKKIKQGLVLCTRTEEWYTKKKSTMREVQLRKTRLRWRQFRAVLKPDRLELYHVTTIIMTTTKRLAHVIYLNNQYPYRKVKLSLVSAKDYIWSLEFLHYETKSLIAYHFQSNSLSDSQDWYMSIYRILPPTIQCKNPIPPIIDIFIILKRSEQQQSTFSQQPLSIRIPLDLILESLYHQDTLLNIKVSDIKPVIWNLFKKKGILNLLAANSKDTQVNMNDLRLCWRSVDSVKRSGEGAAAATKSTAISSSTPTQGEFIEWINNENSELIGPQLIEQKHRLELRNSKVVSEKTNELKSKSTITFDGLLIHKQWNSNKYKRTPFYCILYGHQLFFLEKSYYFYYKRLRNYELEQQSKPGYIPNLETNQKNNGWFAATTGGIYLHQQKNKTMNNNNNNKKKKKKNWQHVNHSTPNLSPSNTAVEYSSPMANTPPDPIVLSNTRLIIDLKQVTNVQPMEQPNFSHEEKVDVTMTKTFEIHIRDEILYYEAPDTQTMLDWVTLIKSKIKIDPQLLLGHYNGFETHQSQPENVKDILQSGILYVKQDFQRSFQPHYCVLAKNEHGSILMMFDTLKKKNQWWWLQFDILNKNQQQRQQLPVYEKKRQLIQLENTFVYSGDSCILDKLVPQASKVEPLKYYKDGTVTGGNTTSECVFVIWQLSKRHIIPNIREYLSLFKLGHHLGNRGSSWVFKARSRQERDEWVWALHKEFGVLKL